MKKTSRAMIFFLLATGTALFSDAPAVIATNGWTAAFAELAGAEDLEVLAPYEMKHPPEYELSLAELRKVAQADFIVFAGYETMMKRIKEALGKDSKVQLIQIQTVNSFPVISESVLKIAAALGTEEVASVRLEEVESFFEDWKKDLEGQDKLNNLVVHFHQQGPVGGLGLEPAMVFGPAVPSLAQIRDVLQIHPDVIIDNLHNPVAAPFLEQENPPAIVRWINFPGIAGTVSLLDVLRYNREQLNMVLSE